MTQGQIEYEMPLQVLNPDPKKRFLVPRNIQGEEQQEPKKFLHLMMKKRYKIIS